MEMKTLHTLIKMLSKKHSKQRTFYQSYVKWWETTQTAWKPQYKGDWLLKREGQSLSENGWETAHPIDTFNNMIIEASDILNQDDKWGRDFESYYDKVDGITDNVHNMDLAKDKGVDTVWAKDNRRNIMLQFVN